MNFLGHKKLDLNSVCNIENYDEVFGNFNSSYTNQSDHFVSSTTIGSIESASSDFYYVAFNSTFRKRKSIISPVNFETTFMVNNRESEYETEKQKFKLSQLPEGTDTGNIASSESTILNASSKYLEKRWNYKNSSKYVYLYDADRNQHDKITQSMSYRSRRKEVINNYTEEVNMFNDTTESTYSPNASKHLNIIYASNWINLRTYINEVNKF